MTHALDHLEATYRAEVKRRGSAPSVAMIEALRAVRDEHVRDTNARVIALLAHTYGPDKVLEVAREVAGVAAPVVPLHVVPTLPAPAVMGDAATDAPSLATPPVALGADSAASPDNAAGAGVADGSVA